ncbi:MAG: hypothetical protein QXQ69_03140 [Candidatus Aenigmatarchaeota archaeon]
MRDVKKSIFLLLTFFSLISYPAKAGLMVVKGSLQLKPLDSIEVCDAACVFSTYSSPISCRVEGSKEINKFLEPLESFQLTENILDCPSEPEARRECIASNCSLTSNKARLVCLKFKGPLEFTFKPSFELYPEKIEYRGAIKAVCQAGAATTVEPLDFWVNFYPLNLFPLLLGICTIVLVLILLFFLVKKGKVKIVP